MGKIEKGSGNVYADLGMPDAEEMLVKAQLSTKIAEIIKLRKMTQTQAAAQTVQHAAGTFPGNFGSQDA